MDKCIIFKSLLIYLLLCYGKKFIDAIDYRKPSVISQEDSTSSLAHHDNSFPSHAFLNSNQSAGTSPNSFDLDEVDDSGSSNPRVAAATSGAQPQPRQRAPQTGAQRQAGGSPQPVSISLDDDDDEQKHKAQAQPQAQAKPHAQAQAPRQIKAVPVEASAGASPLPRARAQPQTAQRAGQGASKPVAISLDDDDEHDKSKVQQGERKIKAVPVAAAPLPQQSAGAQGASSASSAPAAQPQLKSSPQVGTKVISKTQAGSPSSGSEIRIGASQSASTTPPVKSPNPNSNPLETDPGTDIDVPDSVSQQSPSQKAQPQQQTPEEKLPIVKPSRLKTIPETPDSDSGSDIDFSEPSPPQQAQPKPQQVQPQAQPQAVQPKPQQVQPQAQPQAVQSKTQAVQPQVLSKPQQVIPQVQPKPQAVQPKPQAAQPQAVQPKPQQVQPLPKAQAAQPAQPLPKPQSVQPLPKAQQAQPQRQPVQAQPKPQAIPAQQPQQPKPQPPLPANALKITEPVEIITSTDDGQRTVNDLTKFTFEDYAYGYLFKFSKSNKCVEIKYAEKEVWKYSGVPEDVYPKSICVRKDNPVILFEFEGCYYLYGCVENKFKFIHYDEFYAVYNKIKVITQHLGTFSVNDSKAYDVIHYGLLFEYRFKANHLCSEVKFNDKLAWNYDYSFYGDNFPTVMYFDVISPIMVSLFIKNTPYVFVNLNDEWQPVENVLIKQTNPVLPTKKPVSTSVSLPSGHESQSGGESIEIDVSDGEAPAHVKAKKSADAVSGSDIGSEIELTDTAADQTQPPSSEQTGVPVLTPVMPKDSSQTSPMDQEGDDLHLVDGIEVTEIRRSGQPAKEILEDYEEFTIEDQKASEDDKIFVHEKPVRLVVLDIQDTQTTKFINYSYDLITKTHIYTPKETYYISEVKMDDHVFWRATNDNYGFGVIFIEDLEGKPFLKVFIPEKDDLNDEDKAKIIEKEILDRTGRTPKGPQEADDILIPPDAPASEDKTFDEETPEQKMPILVDIRTRDTTEHYDYSRRNSECGMYTPKHNFIFKLVKTSRIIGSDVEIWCPEKEDEYVTKVFIDIIGVLLNTYNVMLFLVNGDVKHFTLLNDRWIEVDPAILLDISKCESTFEYDAVKDDRNDITSFTPRGHFLFKGVKKTHGISGLNKSVVDIWNAQNKCDYARKAVLKNTKRSEKYLLLYLISGGYKLYYRSNKGKVWRDESTNLSSFNNLKTYGIDLDQESMDKTVSDKYLSMRITDGVKIPVTLNIENRKNTNESYYVVNGPIVSFIPKHNIVFENVVLKSHVYDVAIWNAQDAFQHAYRVVIGNNPWNPYKKRSMALILLNGNFIFFEEFEDYIEWKNTSDSRYSLLNLRMFENDRDLSGRYKQIESGDFKIHSLAFLYGYTFNPGVECLEIRYRNLPIWKFSDNPRCGFPRGIYLNIANNGFYIKYFDRWSFVDMDQARARYTKPTPGPPKKTQPETPNTYALSSPLLVSNIRVTTMIGERPFVHNLSHFTLLEGYLVSTFEFTEKLFKVEYADKVVWKHKVIRYGTNYPNKVYFDHLGYLIVSFTDNWYYVYEYTVEKWKIVCKNEIDKPEDLPGMAIITDEVQPMLSDQHSMPVPSMSQRPQEVEDQHISFQADFPKPVQSDLELPQQADKSLVTLDLKVLHDERYDISYLANKVVYKAKAPNLFYMVKSGNDILWQTTKNEYPYKVIYKEVDGKDKLKVYFPSEQNPILERIKSERR